MKKLSYIGLGILIGLVLSIGTAAYASELSSLVGKKVGSVWSIELNGSQVSDAVIIDGRSYAPVRAISEALGLDVDFTDGKVILNDKVKEDDAVTPETEGNNNSESTLTYEQRLAQVIHEIATVEQTMGMTQWALDDAKQKGGATSEYVANMEKVIADKKAQLEALKEEKAALEAYLSKKDEQQVAPK